MTRSLAVVIAFTLSGLASYAQTPLPKTEVKRGISTTYYNQSDTVHFKGKVKSDMREGVWNYYKYTTGGAQVVYKFETYVAGVKEGPFWTCHGDTIEQGTYSMDQLQGAFERYQFMIGAAGDTALIPLNKGEYNAGTMVGKWQNFEGGKLAEEGTYLIGKKSKLWKTYWVHSQTPNDLHYTTEYESGLKHGKQTFNFGLMSEFGSWKKEQEERSYTWYKGVKTGPYSVKDKDGFVIEEGSYIDDKKDGEAFTYDREKQEKCKFHYMSGEMSGPATFMNRDDKVTIKGGFNKGQRNGKWTWMDPESGSKMKEMTYVDGIADGEARTFHSNGNEAEFQKIEKGVLVEMIRFAEDGETELESFEIDMNEPGNGKAMVDYTSNSGDSTQHIMYMFTTGDELTPDNFLKTFNDAKVKQGHLLMHGTYSLYLAGTVHVSGNYTKGKKDGVWDYKYHPTIVWQVTYQMDVRGREYFEEKGSSEGYKGEYIVNFPSGKVHYQFKVKDGLKNGKCLTYDSDGMLLLEEKYKAGVLQE